MKLTRTSFFVPLLTPLLMVGCATDAPSTSETDQALSAANGKSLNGISMNGVSLNGKSLNGVSMNGVSMNGVSMNGVSMNGVSLNGTSLNGRSLNGVSMNGVSMNGTTWNGNLSDGTTIQLRIDSYEQGTGANSDLSFYGVSYLASDDWHPICGTDSAGVPIKALAVAGTWNTEADVVGGGAYANDGTQFTWACRGKTIGKCVEMGYKGWLGYDEQLQSCVRMLRGDYCGNGHAYTADGQTVNLYDNAGVQTDTESWGAESEWTSAGARCILDTAHTRYTHVGNPTPSCVTAGTLPTGGTCGASFANGATLINELPAF